MDTTSMTGRFTAMFQHDTTARVYADPALVVTEESAEVALADSEFNAEGGHPAFQLLSFWHSMGVLGIDTVAHHA